MDNRQTATIPTSPIALHKPMPNPHASTHDVKVTLLRSLIDDVITDFKNRIEFSEGTSRDAYDDVIGNWRLARFLQSVEGDVEEAARVVRNHIAWRKEVDSESIRKIVRNSPFRISNMPHGSILVKAGMKAPCVDSGRSRLGDVIHLEAVGQGDARGLIKNVSEQQLLEHYVGFFESRSMLLESESAKSSHIVRTIQIRDMSSLGLHLMSERGALAVLQNLVKMGSENYPESTAYAIFTRTPSLFSSAWSIVARILPARTTKKVRFVSFADTPITLMRYVQPRAIVALQDLVRGKDGDVIADELIEPKLMPCSSYMVEVPARSSEHVYVALNEGEKCSFSILDEQNTDLTGFCDILYVTSEHHQNILPECVEVHTMSSPTKGSASCPPTVVNCLVVIILENGSWFSSKTFCVNVQTS